MTSETFRMQFCTYNTDKSIMITLTGYAKCFAYMSHKYEISNQREQFLILQLITHEELIIVSLLMESYFRTNDHE